MGILKPVTVVSSPPVPPADPGFLSKALQVAGRLANDAADVIAATAGQGARPTVKSTPYDWVTDTDRTLERHTRRVLAAEFPTIPVLGEEYGAGGTADAAAITAGLRWVVDPVDGTANYVAGLPWCSYSLALVDTDGPVVGVVADPYRSQIYAAARGRGTRANGVPVRLAHGAQLAGGVVCLEVSASAPWTGAGAFMSCAAAEHTGMRVLGSSALAITQVALGHARAALLTGYQEWDVAGAVALATEAGAVAWDGAGTVDPLPPDGLLVAAPNVAETVLGWWQRSRRSAPEAGPEHELGAGLHPHR